MIIAKIMAVVASISVLGITPNQQRGHILARLVGTAQIGPFQGDHLSFETGIKRHIMISLLLFGVPGWMPMGERSFR